MQPDLIVDGRCMDIKAFSMTTNSTLRSHSRPIVTGAFEVSGTLTAYFSNDALLAAILGKPHKASVWKSLRPKLYRASAYAALALALSFILISGVV